VINHHDRDLFEVHLVSLGGDPSASAGYCDHAHDVIWQAGSSDDETVARRLAAAGIDVLVDLNAYSAPKGLRLFLRRPAPVQLGWFNSFATSGLDCFDGIVGDDAVIPAAEEGFYTERVLRVQGTYLAFEVLYAVPDVASPTSASTSRAAPHTSTFCAATIASTSRWTRSPTTAARRRPRRCGRALPS
jgi:predicted O-linked N-acetylglucosamine transferase (SPINDLY family)